MSELLLALVIAVSVWSAVLTLVILVLIRQVSLLTVRADLGLPRYSVSRDGPEIGALVPDSAQEALPDFRGGLFVLHISATCAPCRELVPDLAKLTLAANVVALLTGRPELADSLEREVPKHIRVLRDPDATAIAHALGIKSTPFAMHLEDGRVRGKAYLRAAGDLVRLVEAGKRSKPVEEVA